MGMEQKMNDEGGLNYNLLKDKYLILLRIILLVLIIMHHIFNLKNINGK